MVRRPRLAVELPHRKIRHENFLGTAEGTYFFFSPFTPPPSTSDSLHCPPGMLCTLLGENPPASDHNYQHMMCPDAVPNSWAQSFFLDCFHNPSSYPLVIA